MKTDVQLKPYDISGKVFGYLSVIVKVSPKGSKSCMWACHCSCGNECTVAYSSLVNGLTRSCGCLKLRTTRERNTSHGMSGSPEYSIWCDMKKRCKDESTPFYGEKGITVCDRWSSSFENFIEDMGEKPYPEASVERVDNNRGYSPDNCKWASRSTQSANRTLQKNNPTGFIGVSLDKRYGGYIMKIAWQGKRHEKKFRNIRGAVLYREYYILVNNLPHTSNITTEVQKRMRFLIDTKCSWATIESIIKEELTDERLC